VKDIQAVVFFKELAPDNWRVSMRSKGNVDINAVAKEFGGGGHKNASGCSATGELTEVTRVFERKILAQIDKTAI
jgi:phosphoesterase RecJ-like protein